LVLGSRIWEDKEIGKGKGVENSDENDVNSDENNVILFLMCILFS